MSQTLNSSNAAKVSLPPENYIPYPLRAQITQIDPKLDIFWQENLKRIFAGISPQQRKNVAGQLLAKKNIFWNSEKKNFEYRGEADIPFEQICSSVPAKFKELKILAMKMQAGFEALKEFDHTEQIADCLEDTLKMVGKCNPRNTNLEQQLVKQKLHQSFIYAAAAEIRQKKELYLSENIRGLSSNTAKVFINEVFLKQQLLGFWFGTLRNRRLRESDQSIMREFLAAEQKERQLEVVQTSRYLFVLAPMLESSGNPFTIKRFLAEERLFGGQLLLKSAVLNITYAENSEARHKAEDAFKKQIDRIITIKGNVRKEIVDFVEKLDVYHEENLLPLLFAPLEADENTDQRLKWYEQRLNFGILQPFCQAVQTLPNSVEEFDYLYVSIRQLMGAVITAFKDFQTLQVAQTDENNEKLLIRLVAYTAFLEKRRVDVFVAMGTEHWKENDKKTQLFFRYVKDTVKKYVAVYETKKEAVEAEKQLLEKPASWLGKVLKSKEKQEEKLQELKKAARAVQYEAHSKLYDLPEEIKSSILIVEFDTLIIVDSKMRSYAYPDGDNGVSALPQIITIPENQSDFDLEGFAIQIGVIYPTDEE